ncbi:ABC transporter permease/substrate binding protein [Pseudolactococcus carnosus]|uniref:ABC transporter permease subunit n=1 Tax=Pseudolactococcus carnosus TaxID=2749961 RepID=A0ABT0ARW0_9LACT|nr:ABC transporter permease/substrate binding protein [Lactococcus carnosus]MCJ1989429.1 ABC transporter permease subunit [Lactococcus carnosus]MCJ2002257.1 ABC transporter permease subunit [Lactococcus carnosus]SCA91484.1 glycine betaine ABC transporter (permease, modular protein) [Lactococcus piscium]
MFNLLTSQLPISNWASNCVDWLTEHFAGFFNLIQQGGNALMDAMTNGLVAIPMFLVIAGLFVIAVATSPKKWGFPIFTLLGLLLIANQGLWEDLMSTMTLVIMSALISLIIGVPLGILMAKSDRTQAIVQPILDFMQTMPGFVYLIPAVAFFGIGVVPGVFASIIFALPPVVRMTNLGIRQVPTSLVEAADSFGSTTWQKLIKLELPSAKNTILAGANQTIMLALSMVVTASMIGAPGLGRGVLSAVQHADVGAGFVNGIALVILAIIIDRFAQKLNTKPGQKSAGNKTRRWLVLISLLVMIGGGIVNSFSQASESNKKISLGYVQWDSEVASTTVLGQALKAHGYNVTLTPLDNAVLWQSVANKQVDASLSAWLPNTHGALLKKYKDNLTVVGTNLTGVKTGLVVPDYMSVKSISDLTDQANKTITGIEPGAGIMATTADMMKVYPNLKDWNLQVSSSGAMVSALDKAYRNKEDIVLTGWSPHWMFSKYKLKYLEDPQKAMGEKEAIKTIARKNLKSDDPDTYKILEKFKWTSDDMEGVMLDIQAGMKPTDAADKWIKANQKTVDSWFKN